LIERTVYGTKPTTATTTGTVTKNGTTGTITVNVSDGGKNASFTASITYPSGNGPFPAVILYDNSGATSVVSQGVATINYTPFTIGDEGNGSSRTNKKGKFYDLYGSNSKTGYLAAWAWGVSRIIDVIEKSGSANLKADAIGVTGCSRFGKGAFAAGVLDQRIALTMPMESGTGGVPVLRGAIDESGAQSPSNAYGEKPWFGDDFSPFQNKPGINNLPIDMHEAVAMVAPRGIFIMEKPGAADWLASKSGHLSAVAGSKVYEALGVGGNLTYHSNTTNGNHCVWTNEWNTPLQDNIKRFLLRTATPPATPTINPRSNVTGNQNLINWTTPNLGGSVASSSSGGSSSSSVLASSSSSSVTLVCGEYQESFCGGIEFANVLDNSVERPGLGLCIFIGDFEHIQPDLNSTVSINGIDNICGSDWSDCPYNEERNGGKPDKKDGGYYVYVKDGSGINSYQSNGWQGIVAKAKPECTTPSSSSGTEVTPSSSSQGETPIAIKAPLTHFSVQALSGKVLLVKANSPAVVKIYDLKGNKAAEFNVISGSQKVNLSLPGGIYFAKAKGVQNLKFILQ
jgi:hypothetical protein